ncbi:hypothetical protein OHC33_005044 [Knufia fluminis]|uniref:Uncharacterized protein n=1 Tax=Knufia fluminis TaxID=191047 RepID=A0AAN8EQG6_9EURO|nr:hypothetical protein OHC33_005044 [Knufia fluminis]
MDDLVLHTVLAISRTHLQHSSPSISSLASKHYSYALHSLKQRLADWLSGSDEDYKPLFATIILLCHCEFIQGNTYGAAMQHLRACREFVEAALEHLHESEHRDFVVYLVKNYGYFVLVTNLRGSLQVDNIRLGLEFSTYIMLKIKKFSAIGPMFDFEPEGISLIPQIAQLAWQRKQSPSASDYQVCQATYVRLLESLNRELQQCLSGKVADTQSSSGLKLWNTRQLVISIKINTLLMFLHASFPQHDGRPTLITGLLQPLIDRTMMLLTHVDEANACYSLFWPILVMGSYVRDRAKQGLLVSRLETNQSRMQYLSGGIELLQWLWEDQDGMNFGLEGLETVAAARGVHLCIC